jgi:hypothetical protein
LKRLIHAGFADVKPLVHPAPVCSSLTSTIPSASTACLPLRANIEAGLDHGAAQGDIHCIGDAGNISYGTFFSGI